MSAMHHLPKPLKSSYKDDYVLLCHGHGVTSTDTANPLPLEAHFRRGNRMPNLTNLAVAGAKPRASRYEVPDTAVRGLRLVVQPSGAKSWAVRYRRPDGSTAKLTLGTIAVVDLKAARGRALEAMSAVAAGSDPGEAKKAVRVAAKAKAKPAVMETTAAAITLFIERHAAVRNRESVRREAKRILDRELSPWAARRLADITPADIHSIMDAKMDAGAPAAANRTLAVLRRFFRFAVERGIIGASPCVRIGAPAPTTARERVLSAEELATVWQASEGLGHPFGPMILLLILTGQRRGEVASMRVADVDLTAGTWTIPAAIAKNGKAHVVHLAPAAADIVGVAVSRDRVGEHLFGALTAPSGWSKAKRRLDAAIGDAIVEPWTLHDLRRSMATGLAGLGIALPVIERLLNHTSGVFGGIVQVYQKHDFIPEREAALTRWADFLSGVPSKG